MILLALNVSSLRLFITFNLFILLTENPRSAVACPCDSNMTILLYLNYSPQLCIRWVVCQFVMKEFVNLTWCRIKARKLRDLWHTTLPWMNSLYCCMISSASLALTRLASMNVRTMDFNFNCVFLWSSFQCHFPRIKSRQIPNQRIQNWSFCEKFLHNCQQKLLTLHSKFQHCFISNFLLISKLLQWCFSIEPNVYLLIHVVCMTFFLVKIKLQQLSRQCNEAQWSRFHKSANQNFQHLKQVCIDKGAIVLSVWYIVRNAWNGTACFATDRQKYILTGIRTSAIPCLTVSNDLVFVSTTFPLVHKWS